MKHNNHLKLTYFRRNLPPLKFLKKEFQALNNRLKGHQINKIRVISKIKIKDSRLNKMFSRNNLSPISKTNKDKIIQISRINKTKLKEKIKIRIKINKDNLNIKTNKDSRDQINNKIKRKSSNLINLGLNSMKKDQFLLNQNKMFKMNKIYNNNRLDKLL